MGSALLFLGNLAAQGAALAASPWLARLYSPERFGEFSLFSGAVSCMAQLACLKYDMAAVTAKSEADARALFWAAVFICPIAALAGAAVLWFFYGENESLSLWAPLAALFAGWFSALSSWRTRQKEWPVICRGTAAKGAGGALLQLVLAWTKGGLMTGQAAAWGIGAALMVYPLPPLCRAGEMRRAARKYRAFPLFSLPGAFAGTAAYSVVPFWISSLYGEGAAGQYGLVSRILGAPLALLSGAVSQVFLRRAAEERAAGNGYRKLYFRISLWLAGVSLPVFAAAALWAEPLIAWALGEQWRPAAGYLRALLPLFWVRLAAASVSTAGIAAGRQRATALWQGGLLLGALGAWGAARVLGLAPEGALVMLCAVQSICYLAFYVYCGKNCT